MQNENPLENGFHHLLAATLMILLMGVAGAPTLSAACPGDFLVSPDTQGQDSGTLLDNFDTLMADLTHAPVDASDQHAVRRLTLGGETHVIAPWFNSSTECSETRLNDGGILTSPNFDDYLMVSDELSELAVVASLWTDDELMMGIHHTVQAMESSTYSGLPCWIARVQETTSPPRIDCQSADTASDGTVRLGLAYYHAANNPYFPASSRALYRSEADAMAYAHLNAEYAQGQRMGYLNRSMDHWIAGGANTAQSLSGMHMWVGYHQDVALFLLAAYVATEDPAFATRAEDVVNQWLLANEFDGSNLSMGAKEFQWDTSVDPLEPIRLSAWDESDAPRALWMGHVLRARNLAVGGSLSPTYSALSDWVQLLLDSGTQDDDESCIQYEPDGSATTNGSGTPVNCGDNYYYNGLGMGLLTERGTAWLPTKLQHTLTKYAWGQAGKYWDWTDCFGIYRGIRPVKALASALGFDAATYGGRRPGVCRLTVSRTGDGTGFVLSDPAGIDCGSTCTEVFLEGEAVALTATPYEGSTFDGWTVPACSGGSMTMSSDLACTASFSGACESPLVLSNQTVTTDQLFTSCGDIWAGDGFEVLSGTTTLRAGGVVMIGEDFSVATGAGLEIEVNREP